MEQVIRFVFSTLCVLASFQAAFAQTQLGADINGEAAADRSGIGHAISSNGRRLAIGADMNDGGGVRSGHVRVFEWSNTTWTQLGIDIDGEESGDFSGNNVAISSDGNRIAIGATGNSGNGMHAGHVRVYDWDGEAWLQQGMDIDGENHGDGSGRSVSFSSNGNRLAIGAPKNNNNAGHVRIFDWINNEWVQAGLDIDGVAGEGAGFRIALSSDGNRLAITAPGLYGLDHGGQVRVYEWTKNMSWQQLGLPMEGDNTGDRFGSSVALSAAGNRVAVGAYANNGYAGHVKVFDWDGLGWTQAGEAIAGEADYDSVGSSIAISSDGNRLAVGASGYDGISSDMGKVQVYDWVEDNWLKVGADIVGEALNDYSGTSVSLSADGSRVSIGARGNDGSETTGNDVGHVRVFELSNLTASEEIATQQLTVFPNPTRGLLRVKSQLITTLSLSDSKGILIWQGKGIDFEIDLSGIADGLYLLRSESRDQIAVEKIIKF